MAHLVSINPEPSMPALFAGGVQPQGPSKIALGPNLWPCSWMQIWLQRLGFMVQGLGFRV